MAKEKQFQGPMSDTKAYFVVSVSPHNTYADLARTLVPIPKEETAENPRHREDFERLLKGMAKSSE